MRAALRSHGVRLLLLVLMCALALQLAFLLRIAAMRWIDPQSTTFQRSEIARLLQERGQVAWAQEWVDLPRISTALQRAVIASEDAAFVDHRGIDWDAVESAWDRNQRAQARAERQARRSQRPANARVVGGSTITQQLAKNLLLSGERTTLRKAQEAVLTLMLEVLLDKRRILEIYLNVAEWGVGVFGCEAAARHHFGTSCAQLAPAQAARLAAMLPRPRYYDRNRASPALARRTSIVLRWMGGVTPP